MTVIIIMDLILKQQGRLPADHRSLTSSYKSQRPSTTQKDLQFVIESILKQYNKNPPKKSSCSPFQNTKKFSSQTPCNQSRHHVMDFGAQPHTTKAGFFRKGNFFNQPVEEAVSSYLIGYQPAPQPIDEPSSSPLQTEIEVTDYMFPPQRPLLMKLGDPLIDETAMAGLEEVDLTSRVPYLWMRQSDEGTTISRSDSCERYASSKDKTQTFKEKYMVGKQIGSGSYASVRHCVDRKSLKAYALKIYSKCSLTVSRKKSILREIRLLQYIQHPNIIKIQDALETNNHVNLLLELVQGNSLAQLYKSKPFTTPQIKSILHQSAMALAYLHKLSITHRDIKLENILYTGKGEVKLIDFGFSTLMRQKKKMFCGTPSYMAPEIVRRTCFKGQPVDIWALGITLYAMICQQFPFKGCNDKDLYSKISHGEFSMHLVDDDHAQDLLSRMICANPEYRITAEEILCHPWLNQPVYDNFSLLLNRVKAQRSDPRQPIKTFKYNRKEERQTFFTQKVKSCLNSPRAKEQSCQQSTVKKIVDKSSDLLPKQRNYFKGPITQHNQTIQPSFVPSFMSSVQSVKSQDSNKYLSKRLVPETKKGFGNQTFNDGSGMFISFNNSVLHVEPGKPFQNLINKLSRC